MQYHFRVHEASDGLWAECVELSGCVTQGDSRNELERNAREALELYLDEPAESGIAIVLPLEGVEGEDIISIEIPPELAFGLFLRHYRIEKKLTQKNAMAAMLGMNHVYCYQWLEKNKIRH